MATVEEQIVQSQIPIPALLGAENPQLIEPEKQIEIVNGKAEIKEMSGARAGGIATRLSAEIWFYVKKNKLGRVYGADTTFTIGANDRMPDVSFVSADKIPESGEPLTKWDFAPDLAIEVISPGELFGNVHAKIREYFAASVRQVWIVSPFDNTLSVYKSPTEIKILTASDELVCEDILPEFRLKLSEIFID